MGSMLAILIPILVHKRAEAIVCSENVPKCSSSEELTFAGAESQVSFLIQQSLTCLTAGNFLNPHSAIS